LRVLYTVSPALVTSAAPATRSRMSLSAFRLRLVVLNWTELLGGTSTRAKGTSFFFRDMMGMVMLMNVTGLMARVEGNFVIGAGDMTGTGSVMKASHAAFVDPAEKASLFTALGAAVESGLWGGRRRRALAVAAPSLAPLHP
jgi:hypothetical protein